MWNTTSNPVSPGFICFDWYAELRAVNMQLLTLNSTERHLTYGANASQNFLNGELELDTKRPDTIGLRRIKCQPTRGGFVERIWEQSSRFNEMGRIPLPWCPGSEPEKQDPPPPDCHEIGWWNVTGLSHEKEVAPGETTHTLTYWDFILMSCYLERRCPSLPNAFAKAVALAGLLMIMVLMLLLISLFLWRINREHGRHQRGEEPGEEGGIAGKGVAGEVGELRTLQRVV